MRSSLAQGYRARKNNPVNCFFAQSNETPRAKAAGVAAGKRMLELERCVRHEIPDQVGDDRITYGVGDDGKLWGMTGVSYGMWLRGR